jgi:glycosyltransferase involved in cell wall biosynthesis
MATRPISVVVTVRNDREGLRELLPGLASQLEPPDEVVVVDGGSVDGTLDVVTGFGIGRGSLRTALAPGANIAGGRNIGVRLARNDLIACTDAGCRPEPGWLRALSQGLERADLVGGPFVADGRTPFEQIVSLTYFPVPQELGDPSLLTRLAHRLFGRSYVPTEPVGASMAFRRDVWEAAGGFPEDRFAGEDRAFAQAVADRGLTTAFVPQAVVRWRPRGTWRANARMFHTYCRGDVRSRKRTRHAVRLLAWTASTAAVLRGRTTVRALVAIGVLAHIALPVQRARDAGIAMKHWWRIPVAVAVKDLSQLVGAAMGLIDALRGRPQPMPGRPVPK